MHFFSVFYCSISNVSHVQTRLLSSFASIRCFIFHHFSQKPLKNCLTDFDALLVIFEIQEFLTCCHIINQPHQLACSPRVQQFVESSPCQVKSNTIKLVFSAFPLSMQYSGVRATTGFLRIRFMSPSEAICLLDDCFSELTLSRSNLACWPSIKWTSSSHRM